MLWLQSVVLSLDDTALDIDQVENLIMFFPTKEEMDLLKVGTIQKSCCKNPFILWYVVCLTIRYMDASAS